MLFTVIKFDKGLGVAVVEPAPTLTKEQVWAEGIINKITHPDVGDRIDARFDALINTLEKVIQDTETVVTEDDGEI